MNGKERISRILKRQPVDRIGVGEYFWADTVKKYVQEGHVAKDEVFDSHFGLDFQICRPLNLMADLNFKDEILEDRGDTVLIKDGNGATLLRHKHHVTTPEQVDFSIRNKSDWEKIRHFYLEPDERRIDFKAYREAKAAAEKAGRFFLFGEFNVFALMHPISGHEYTLMGMALEPEWILDMAETFSNLSLRLQEILYEREGRPDAVWYYEDLGFKDRPFMSPDMYEEMLFPTHKKTVEAAHAMGLPVIFHSCGFIEPLLPKLVETGIDCLQPMEVKAGMDVLRIYEKYGDKIALMGGIDVRVLLTNDRDKIKEELERKIPVLKKGKGYILHSDHSIPDDVEYETLQYYFKLGLELGKY